MNFKNVCSVFPEILPQIFINVLKPKLFWKENGYNPYFKIISLVSKSWRYMLMPESIMHYV
jgi:hypothetical protein